MCRARTSASTRLSDLGHRLAAKFERERDVAPHRATRQERALLEDHGDVAIARRDSGDVAPVNQHSAALHGGEPGDRPQQRRLAAARRSDDRNELPVGDVEVHTVQRDHAAGADRRLVENDRCHRAQPRSVRSPDVSCALTPSTHPSSSITPDRLAAATWGSNCSRSSSPRSRPRNHVANVGNLASIAHRLARHGAGHDRRPDLGDHHLPGASRWEPQTGGERPDVHTIRNRRRSRSSTGMPSRLWLPTAPAPSNCHDEKGRRPRRRRTASTSRHSGGWPPEGTGLVVVRQCSTCRRGGATPERAGTVADHRRCSAAANSKRLLPLRSSSTIESARSVHMACQGWPRQPSARAGTGGVAEREVDADERGRVTGRLDDRRQPARRSGPGGRVLHGERLSRRRSPTRSSPLRPSVPSGHSSRRPRSDRTTRRGPSEPDAGALRRARSRRPRNGARRRRP